MIQAMMCEHLSKTIGGLTLCDLPLPMPQTGEVLVCMKAASVNFPDLLMLQGKYQFRPDLPFAPGLEGAGVVDAVGTGVDDSWIGKSVIVQARFGCYAQAICVPVAQIRPMPMGFSYAQAASFGAAYLTAYVALVRRGALKPGETLLVTGASGGVGLAAVELGKHLGANVIACAGSDEKLSLVKARGADHVINYTKSDGTLGGFRDQVKALTKGRGADVIYDPVGGDVFDEATHCIAWDGRLLVIGFAAGRISKLDVNWPLIKGYSVIGVRAGEYGRRDPVKGAENLAILHQMAESGALRPHIHAILPLCQANEAQALLADRKVVGKVVLEM
jgi:NADPH2:quinone reductase